MSTVNQLSRSYSFQIIYLNINSSSEIYNFKYLTSNKKLKRIYPRGRVFFRLLKLEREKQSDRRCNVKECNKQRHIFSNFCNEHSPKNRS